MRARREIAVPNVNSEMKDVNFVSLPRIAWIAP
jgi:hypothetical protein